ncbi:hypothetical protein RRG08_058198 [Elysia crispata]|uniref:Uncharacterized protein n=1 Tax=Elysia crispata TaxID=231223 RepID=A0AAE0XSQ7_9GAST|nr:hypothetical protein RRG08_065096 [Elysia crispata]KAK3795358.1 hypothetical protein RRG08_058198 [Elysia crispata]
MKGNPELKTFRGFSPCNPRETIRTRIPLTPYPSQQPPQTHRASCVYLCIPGLPTCAPTLLTPACASS